MSGTITPTGYEQITSLASAVGLSSVPNQVNYILVDVEGQDVRYRADGTDPTALIGSLLKVGNQYEYYGNVENLKFIETTAGAKLNIHYYHRVGV